MHIPFNKPFLWGEETRFIKEAVELGHISGNGVFTKRCHTFFQERYGFQKCLLSSSCTDALEMSAILLNIEEGDEVIMPSYTFVSTANAFVLRGAKIVFVDSQNDHPNLDPDQLEGLITDRTKAIVVVHYGGVACDMDLIMSIAAQHNLMVVEDAAQAIDATYKGKPLGSIGHLAAFSFHETKNVISGEGGMLVVNDECFHERSEIIWEKGTNRAAFFRGEVDKYGWVDVGSSFLPSDMVAAFLFGQLQHLEEIQRRRKAIWQHYFDALQPLSQVGTIQLLPIAEYASNNAHLFAVLCSDSTERDALISYLKSAGASAVFHYQSLHASPFFKSKHDGRSLPHADRFSERLLRLPMHLHIEAKDVAMITDTIQRFYHE